MYLSYMIDHMYWACGHDRPHVFYVHVRVGYVVDEFVTPYDNDDGDNDVHDDEDQNGHNSANFRARSPKFCVVVDLEITNR